MLVDLLYLWSIRWARLYSEGDTRYGTLMIVFSVLMFLGALALNVFGYYRFR